MEISSLLTVATICEPTGGGLGLQAVSVSRLKTEIKYHDDIGLRVMQKILG
jgi:hypothetical protein